jgi:transcriptional activator SPT7
MPEMRYRTFIYSRSILFFLLGILICATSTKSTEPPPPFPPPPPFIPIEASRVEDQMIGLLRPYYKSRFDALVGSAIPKPPGTEGEPPLPIVLQDDQPNPGKVKMSPLGQIAGGQTMASSVGPGKKKIKKDKETSVAPAPPSTALGPEGAVVMKKRGGPGRGKKGKMADLPPRPGVILASA